MRERRSTRKAPNVAEGADMDTDYVVSEPDQELLAKKRSKKRKISDDPNIKTLAGKSAAKKVRGRRGILKKLVEMPMDVLFEIFGQLNPLDILNLARTTMDLRAILMSRSSISVWKRARSNIDGFPDCPDDLSEPEYAELAFGKTCYSCHRNHISNIVVWAVRLRTCTKCLHEIFTPEYGCTDYPQSLYDLLPRCPVSLKKGRRTCKCFNVHEELDSQWSEEYRALSADERPGWLKMKLSERKSIQSHADACEQWMSGVRATQMQEKTSLIDERMAIIRKRIEKLGWGDELGKAGTSQKLQTDPAILKACQKEVTEKVLSSLEPCLNVLMTNLRDCRLEEEYSWTFRECLEIIAEIREECVAALPVNSFAPCSADLFSLPAVHDHAMDRLPYGDFTPGDFDFIRESFSELCLQWQRVIQGKLLAMIKKSSIKDYDPETVLHLATTSFKCKGCVTFIAYPRVLVHTCATSLTYGGTSGFELAIRNVFQENNWNAGNCISFDPAQFEAATKVLKLCGLDPHTTKADEMDALDPIFECLACNSINRGRMVMDWPTAVFHHLKISGCSTEPNVQLLNEAEVAKVRERMVEETERAQSSSYSEDFICTHCRAKNCLMELKQHVFEVHGKQNPTDEDVVPNMQEAPPRVPYWLWPPRLGDAPDAPCLGLRCAT